MEKQKEYILPEVRIRLAEGTALYSDIPLNTPESATRCMAGLLSGLDREYVCVVNLNNKLRPLNYNIVSIGGINMAPVSVANIFKTAILSNAGSIMLLHNHPSGDVSPSGNDIAITKKVYEASRLMDIELIDHIIVGGMSGEYYSMHENGFFASIKAESSVAEANEQSRTINAIASMDKQMRSEADTFQKRGLRPKAKKHHRVR